MTPWYICPRAPHFTPLKGEEQRSLYRTKALAGSIQFGCGSHAQFDDGHSTLGDIIFLSSSDLQDIDSLSYQVPDLFISPWLPSLPSTCPANPSQAQQPMHTWPTAVLRG